MSARMEGDDHSYSYSATTIRNGLISGYTAGICGIVIGHPLDSLKVLLQTANAGPTNPSSASGSGVRVGAKVVNSSNFVISRASSTAAAAAVSTRPSSVQTSNIIPAGKRSLTSLYAGVTGPLLTVGLIQSINFAVYDSVRRVLYERQLRRENDNGVVLVNCLPDDYLHYDDLQNVAVASFISGGATSFLTSPVTMVKTKQQIMQWSFRKAIQDTWSRGNAKMKLQNFYTGFGIHFCCDAFGRSLYMFTYEYLKRSMSERQHVDIDSNRASPANLSIPQRMICAASAGMTCWAFIYPADVIRSRLYSQSLNSQSLPSTMDGIRLAQQMVRETGYQSLYRGMPISVARAGPVAAAILPVYDYMLDMIS
mmetsp:Transcript_35425/g.72412  ORF Transcript_35425/g.72412 Transcript_35425/m.72412 type:complete len:367 (-) Transcript_35425:355-1455(-)